MSILELVPIVSCNRRRLDQGWEVDFMVNDNNHSRLLFCAISDLHLGEEDSVLTNLELGEPVLNPRGPNRCMTTLVNLLHSIKRELNDGKPIPRLVLLGDVVELAQAPFHLATSFFRTLLFLLSQRKLADRVVYCPGNHDHGLWSLARNSAWLEGLCSPSDLEARNDFNYTTQISRPARIPVLERLGKLFPEYEHDIDMLVAYPNYRLVAGSNHEFIFTHGHFMEDSYKLMSIVARRLMENVPTKKLSTAPRKTVEELEKDNAAWIDFVWSGIASSGQSGALFERIYEAVMVRDREVAALLDRVSVVLKEEYDIPYVIEAFEDSAFKAVLKKILGEMGVIGSHHRASARAGAFTRSLESELKAYITNYISRQLASEGDRPSIDKTVFIHGHTHKPYFQAIEAGDFKSVAAVNTGGWVVESKNVTKADPRRPGVVIGTDHGDVALLTFNKGHELVFECKGTNDIWCALIRERLDTLALELGRSVVASSRIREKHLEQRMKKLEHKLDEL
ncbi:MAG: hypothetical protein GXP49_05370 [Deltaproteobacteria bacterium]|nr:hypothetical protein [Deltaproteobacteria bacterium]